MCRIKISKAFIQNIFLILNIHSYWSIWVALDNLLKDCISNAFPWPLSSAWTLNIISIVIAINNHCHTYCSCSVLWRRQRQRCFRRESFFQLSDPNILDTPALMLSLAHLKSNETRKNFSHLHFWQSITHVTDNMTILGWNRNYLKVWMKMEWLLDFNDGNFYIGQMDGNFSLHYC